MFRMMSKELMQIKELIPMPPEKFRTELARRGWDAEMLRIRWGMTKRRVQQIIADEDRPRYYDDAILALPTVLTK